MNKKLLAVTLAVFVYALDGAMNVNLMAQTKSKAEIAAEKAALAEQERLAAKRQALTKKAAQLLNGKQWSVYVTAQPATGKSAAAIETDIFIFADYTVKSQNLSALGYAKNGSNYSLRVADNGTATWETMQLHENGQDIVFLRGELDTGSGTMQGVIIYKPSKGSEKACPYSTIKPQEAEPGPQAAPPAVVTEGTAKKSKKKGQK